MRDAWRVIIYADGSRGERAMPGAAEGTFLAVDLPLREEVRRPIMHNVPEPAERSAAVERVQQPLA
jgi:hypothetical protein